MLGVAGTPGVYLAHAHHFFGFLMGGLEKTVAYRGFHALMRSEIGKRITQGGDLRNAIQNGPLNEMMYTYRMRKQGGGRQSHFLTIQGMLEIMNGLPAVDETIKQRLSGLLAGYLANLSFDQATPEQCEDDEVEEVLDEIFTEGSRGFESVTYEGLRLVTYRYAADNRALAAELLAHTNIAKSKDDVIKAKNAEAAAERSAKIEIVKSKDDLIRSKDAEMAAISAAKDAEIAALKAAATKDAEIMELRMRLLRTERSPRSEPEGASPAKKTQYQSESGKQPTQKNVFLVVYEGEQGLTKEDFQPYMEVKGCYSTKVDDFWVTIINLSNKKRRPTVEDSFQKMRMTELFSGKVFVERRNGGKKLELCGLDSENQVVIQLKKRRDISPDANKLVLHLAELV